MGRELYLSWIVFVGAGLGGVARHLFNRLVPLAITLNFPLSTLLVNAIGCFVMGALTGWFAYRGEQASQHVRLFLTTGVLGGFTTFSAFSIDTALLWQRGDSAGTALYVGLTLLLTLVGVFAGLAAMRALLG
ncbi:MAG TPA: fluoride efflux transporter CrcB [Phenylobacterium sp.]|uniref:fluoride efflux transporter CrcB n=1 Tax=Phenylobacterium sp. TaxID=1871053 RepID=UPI002F93A1C2